MTRIITFFSPKTAGCSHVSYNAALLQKMMHPNHKVAFVEVGSWASLRVVLDSPKAHTWGSIFQFFNTEEWNTKLLSRVASSQAIDRFWSPDLNHYPAFKATQAKSLLKLLSNAYDFVFIDVSAGSPSNWQHFWLEQSDQLYGVITPDPVSEKAWLCWQAGMADKNPSLIVNQAPSSDIKSLTNHWIDKASLAGVLPQDSTRFWYQFYQGVPVVMQPRSKFKKQLMQVSNHWNA